ncbi:MAG: dipeptidase [Pirellulaceae bacterium]|jgi:succinyl-diaminopimelate desuccinylase|nr:dipeptidase [Pirellulaceae bacterium]MDP7014183.1 dipeptidase [Pirellulaceae bacterium]
MPQLDDFLAEHKDRFESDLFDLLAIPSISADSDYKSDLLRAGQWVAEKFRRIGLSVEMVETAGHPIVYAESPPVEGAPTVLVYGHYDVQPPDPLDEWISPPFEPTCRDGNVYARGATDDKGQMLTHVLSAEAWMETAESLPLQIKYVIEGEEEVGSEHLAPFIAENKEKLACDVVVISDTSQFAPGQPAITYGLKGIAYFELRVQGPRQDLHSGTFGGAVSNPCNGLAHILSSLVDEEGRVQIPGFYDDVLPLDSRERRQFAGLPFDERGFMEQIGVEAVHGEAGYSTLERRWARPTYDVNGIWGGYQGEGEKTVLPAKAGAKFSFRLVPDQDPKKIAEALREHLTAVCPPGLELELEERHGAPGFVVSLDSPFMSAAALAIEQGFGRSPVFIREGGSIPIVTCMSEHLGADVLLLGWGLDDDNTHSPNEKFSLTDFHRGIKSSAHLWRELSRIGAS